MNLKKRLERCWFTILLITLIGLGVSKVFHTETSRVVQREVFERRLQNAGTEPSATAKKVTRSLIQLENTRQLSDHVLFFNRVPKTGSEMLVLLLQWLQGQNGFRHVRLPGGTHRRLDERDQEELVEEISSITRREAVPVSFDRHVYFTNFTNFERQQPIYLNLVRDPVNKAVSRFYYGRVTPNPLNPDIKFKISSTTTTTPKYSTYEQCVKNKDPECTYDDGELYDLAIPYFCGHEHQCMVLNDKWALARAKKNVEKFYPVVGVLEELNSTLSVLENKLPLFFKGVTEMYFHDLLEPHRNANRMRPRSIDMYIRSHLKQRLIAEYDFYYWLKSRLLRQAEEIS